ncbi:MAG: FtsW/RodA/SpoVE family cell cycle protein [Paludibacteraceae bacterium]|nr:FtsW/RodA/SpoVE family cell cycle protein [Paludibacteraceae bacterium]
MEETRNKTFSLKGEKTIWTMFFCLIIVSIIEMFSASSMLIMDSKGSYTSLFQRHIIHLGIGFVLTFIISNLNFRLFKMQALMQFLWCGSFALFIAAMVLGKGYQGANRSFMGIQPIEFLKYLTIIVTAINLAKHNKENMNPDDALKIQNIWPLVLAGLIIMENMSSYILILAVAGLLFIIGRVSWKKILKFYGVYAVLGSVLLIVGYTVPMKYLEPVHLGRLKTQVNRVTNFLDNSNAEEEYDIYGENAQIISSQVAIARGNLWPRLPGSSFQRDHLQNAHDDFIFAIIVEELGTVATILLVMLPYWVILLKIGALIKRSDMPYENLIMLGCGLLITLQALIHMMVTCKIGPVTGQSLPLISNGGSSIWATCIGFGIIQCAAKTIQKEIKQKECNTKNEKDTQISD